MLERLLASFLSRSARSRSNTGAALTLAAFALLGSILPAQEAWRQIGPSPMPCYNCGVAYDTNRSRLVTFGGTTAAGFDHSTHEWDGTGWATFAQFTPHPSSRHLAAMTYDSARSRVVLFGGFDGSFLADTWEWDGYQWTQRTPAVSPPGRAGHAMTYDAARGRVVLFGGQTQSAYANNDTWEWDGTNWNQLVLVTNPPASTLKSLAYDAGRQRVVMFGGLFVSSQTWEYDGSDWLLRSPSSQPFAPQAQAGMAYDASRGKTVWFSSSGTWEWDGTNWLQIATATAPALMSGYGMAYDTVRHHIVLFGGLVSLFPNTLSAGLWEYDGAAWSLRNSGAASPPGRFDHAMAYDSARDRVVVFGGRNGNSSNHGDTWELQGSEWQQRNPQFSPAARMRTPLVYDSLRQVCVLFGGINDQNQYFTDTWLYNGTTWTPTYQNGPPARYDHVMAFDSLRGRVVLFGGSQGTGGGLADTWEWDGTSWTLRTPATSPPHLYAASMTFDAQRGRTVLAGVVTAYSFQTWEWDGTIWTHRAQMSGMPLWTAMNYDETRHRAVLLTAEAPWQRMYEWDGTTWSAITPWPSTFLVHSAMVYDSVRHREVAFGGEILFGVPTPTGHDATWAFSNPPPIFATHGTACPGTSGTPALSSVGDPWLGATVDLRLTGAPPLSPALLLMGFSTESWSGLPLPYALTPFGAPLCTLYNSVDYAPALATDATGSATFPFLVPNNPTLTGLFFYAQFSIYDPGANAFNLTFTQGGISRIGGP